MNRVFLLGRVSTEPKISHTASGSPVLNFDIVTVEKWQDRDGIAQEKKQFHQCVQYGKNSTFTNSLIRQGVTLAVEGSLWVSQVVTPEGIKLVSQIKINSVEVLK